MCVAGGGAALKIAGIKRMVPNPRSLDRCAVKRPCRRHQEVTKIGCVPVNDQAPWCLPAFAMAASTFGSSLLPASARDSGSDTSSENALDTEPDTEPETETDVADEDKHHDNDSTAWRAEEEDSDGEMLDSRVASAFEELNAAIAKNNEVEAQFTEAQRRLQDQREQGQMSLATLEKKHSQHLRKIERFRADQAAAQAAEITLRQVEAELEEAGAILELATETLAVQHEHLTPEERATLRTNCPSWGEAEAALEERRAAAAQTVHRLKGERRRHAAGGRAVCAPPCRALCRSGHGGKRGVTISGAKGKPRVQRGVT